MRKLPIFNHQPKGSDEVVVKEKVDPNKLGQEKLRPELKLKCDKCKYVTKSESALNNHMAKKHKIKDSLPYQNPPIVNVFPA